MPLRHTADFVVACILLHNLCIMHKDWVDPNLHLESVEDLEQDRVGRYGQLRSEAIQRIANYGSQQLHAVSDGNQNAFPVHNGEE